MFHSAQLATTIFFDHCRPQLMRKWLLLWLQKNNFSFTNEVLGMAGDDLTPSLKVYESFLIEKIAHKLFILL